MDLVADVITVEHLTVAFPAKGGTGEVVRDVSLAIGAGLTLAVALSIRSR